MKVHCFLQYLKSILFCVEVFKTAFVQRNILLVTFLLHFHSTLSTYVFDDQWFYQCTDSDYHIWQSQGFFCFFMARECELVNQCRFCFDTSWCRPLQHPCKTIALGAMVFKTIQLHGTHWHCLLPHYGHPSCFPQNIRLFTNGM